MESDMICLCDTEDPVEYLTRIKQEYVAKTHRLEKEQQNLEIKIMQVEEFLTVRQSSSRGPSTSSCREIPKVFPKYQDTPTRERAFQQVPKIITETPTEEPGFFQKFRSMLAMSKCTNPNINDPPTKELDSSGQLTSGPISCPSRKQDISRTSSVLCNCDESDVSTSQDISETVTSCLSCVGASTKNTTQEHKTQTKREDLEVQVQFSNKDFSKSQTSQSQPTMKNKGVDQRSRTVDLQIRQCDSSFVDNKKLSADIFASPTSMDSKVGPDSEPKKICSANLSRDKKESAMRVSKSKCGAPDCPSQVQKITSNKDTSYSQHAKTTKSEQIETSNIAKEDAIVGAVAPDSKVVNIQATVESQIKTVNTDDPAVLKSKSVGPCELKTCPSKTRYTQCAFVGSPMVKPMDLEQPFGDNIVEKDEVIQQPKSPQRSKSCDCGPKSPASFPNQAIDNVQNLSESAPKEIASQNKLTSQNQVKTSYNEMPKNLESSCICNSHFSLPTKNTEELEKEIKRVSNELKVENNILKSDLMELKLQMQHTLENIEGPMKQKLETEKLKCECLQDELNETSKSLIVSQDTYQREMNCLKMQLCIATANVTDLNQANEKLKTELKQLDCLCNKLEDNLIKQKLNEADTIKRLTSRRISGGGEGSSVNEFRCPPDLEEITRQLSSTLKEVPCDECTNIPKELRGAAKCIKDLADIVLSNKRTGDSIYRKGASRGDFQPPIRSSYQPISDISEEDECDCACCCGDLKPIRKDEQTVKTLHPVPPDFAESSTYNVGKEQSKYLSATSQPPCGTIGIPCGKEEPSKISKAVCDDIGPCSKSAQTGMSEAGEPKPYDEHRPEEKEKATYPKKSDKECTAPCSKDQKTETQKDLKKDSGSDTIGLENILSDLVDNLPLKEGLKEKEPTESLVKEERPTPLKEDLIKQEPTESQEDVKEPRKVDLTASLPFEEQRFGDFPFEVETKVTATKEPLEQLHTTTTVTTSGTLEVTTEGPQGIIETTLTYTDEGNIEVVTEILDRKEKEPSASQVVAKLSKDSGDFSTDKDVEILDKLKDKVKFLPVDSSKISGPTPMETPYSGSRLTESELTSEISNVSQAMPPTSSLTGTVSGTKRSELGEGIPGSEGVIDGRTFETPSDKRSQIPTESEMYKPSSKEITELDPRGVKLEFAENSYDGEKPQKESKFKDERSYPEIHTGEVTGKETLSAELTGIKSEAMSGVMSKHPKQSEEIIEKHTDYEKIPAKDKIEVEKISSYGGPQIKGQIGETEHREEPEKAYLEGSTMDAKVYDTHKYIEDPEKAKLEEIKRDAKVFDTDKSVEKTEKTKLEESKMDAKLFGADKYVEEPEKATLEESTINAKVFDADKSVEELEKAKSEKSKMDAKVFDADKYVEESEKAKLEESKTSAKVLDKEKAKLVDSERDARPLDADKNETSQEISDLKEEVTDQSLEAEAESKQLHMPVEVTSMVSERKSGASEKEITESKVDFESAKEPPVCDGIQEQLTKSELSPPVKKQRVDCSCQSEDQKDQSCQCCECKEIGITTSGDKETTTEETKTMGLTPDQQSQESDSEFITISETTEHAVAEDVPKQTGEGSDATTPLTTGGAVSAEIQPEQVGDYLPIQGLTVASLEDEEPPEDLRFAGSTEALYLGAGVATEIKEGVSVAGPGTTQKIGAFDQDWQSDDPYFSKMLTGEDKEQSYSPEEAQRKRDMAKKYYDLDGKTSEEIEKIIKDMESAGYFKVLDKEQSYSPEEAKNKKRDMARKYYDLDGKTSEEVEQIIKDMESAGMFKVLDKEQSYSPEEAKKKRDMARKYYDLDGKTSEEIDQVIRDMESAGISETRGSVEKSSKEKKTSKFLTSEERLKKHSKQGSKTSGDQKELAYQELGKQSIKGQQKSLEKASYKPSKIKYEDEHVGMGEKSSEGKEVILAEHRYLSSKDEVKDDMILKKSAESRGKKSDSQFAAISQELKSKSQDEYVSKGSTEIKGKQSALSKDPLHKMLASQELLEKYPELKGMSLEQKMKTLSSLGALPAEVLPIDEDILRKHLEGKSFEEQKMILEKLADSRGVSDESKEYLKQLLCGLIDKPEEPDEDILRKHVEGELIKEPIKAIDKKLSCKAICRSQATIYDQTQPKQAKEKESIGDVPAIKAEQKSSEAIPALVKDSATCKAICKASTKTIEISDRSVSAAKSTEYSRTISTQERPRSVEESASCRASCRNIAIQGSKPRIIESGLSPEQVEELVPAKKKESFTSSSSGGKDRDKKKKKKHSLEEVPMIVSKLSDKDMGPLLERPRKQPRKRRSGSKTLDIIECDCGEICRCIICAPDVMDRRRGACVCVRPQMPVASQPTPMIYTQQPIVNQGFPEARIMNQRIASTAHPIGCTCLECKCDPCTPCPHNAKPGKDKRKPPKPEDCRCKKKKTTGDRVTNTPRPVQPQPVWVAQCNCPGLQGMADTSPKEKTFKSHAKDCECVDCLTMPKIKQLAQTKEYPIVYEKKQVYTVNCDCDNAQNAKSYLKSRIPVPIRSATQASPPVPKSRSQLTKTDESPVSPRPGSAGNLGSIPCDCDPCRCESCPDHSISRSQPSKIDNDEWCCCKAPCVCKKCPIKELLQKLPEREILQSTEVPNKSSQIHQVAQSSMQPPECSCVSKLTKTPSSAKPPSVKPSKTMSNTKPPSVKPSKTMSNTKPPSVKGSQLGAPEIKASKAPEEFLPCECHDPCDCPGEKPVPPGGPKGGEDSEGGEGDIPCSCDEPCDCPGEKPKPKGPRALKAQSSHLNPPVETAAMEGDIPCICDDVCDCPGEKPKPKDPNAPSTPSPEMAKVESKKSASKPEDCTCEKECVCSEQTPSPEMAKVESKKSASKPEDCTCEKACECSELVEAKPSGQVGVKPSVQIQPPDDHLASEERAEQKPSKISEIGDGCVDCKCCQVCACPGRTNLLKKVPSVKASHQSRQGVDQPSTEPILDVPCDCIDCRCDPCADPNRKGVVAKCDCEICECDPCDDPDRQRMKKSSKKIEPVRSNVGVNYPEKIIHPSNCDCEECMCLEDIIKAEGPVKDIGVSSGQIHPADCNCEECKCFSEDAGHQVSSSQNFVTAKTSRIDKDDDCNCGEVCICEDGTGDHPSMHEKKGGQHPDECVCDQCVCVDEKISQHSDECHCDKCACEDDHPPVHKEKGREHSDECTCDKCACVAEGDHPPVHKEKGREHSDECTCDKCACVAEGDHSPVHQEKGREHSDECTCDKCACVAEGTGDHPSMHETKGGQHPDDCICDQCACPAGGIDDHPSMHEKKSGQHPDDCTCDQCACLAEGTGDHPSMHETKGGQHSDDCNCDQCACEANGNEHFCDCKTISFVIGKVLKEELTAATSVHATTLAAKASSKIQTPAAQGNRGSRGKNCTGETCLCIVCGGNNKTTSPNKIASQTPAAQGDRGARGKNCTCETCLCIVCGGNNQETTPKQPSSKIGTGASQSGKGARGKNCTCEICMCIDCDGQQYLQSPLSKLDDNICHCTTCTCEPCERVRGSKMISAMPDDKIANDKSSQPEKATEHTDKVLSAKPSMRADESQVGEPHVKPTSKTDSSTAPKSVTPKVSAQTHPMDCDCPNCYCSRSPQAGDMQTQQSKSALESKTVDTTTDPAKKSEVKLQQTMSGKSNLFTEPEGKPCDCCEPCSCPVCSRMEGMPSQSATKSYHSAKATSTQVRPGESVHSAKAKSRDASTAQVPPAESVHSAKARTKDCTCIECLCVTPKASEKQDAAAAVSAAKSRSREASKSKVVPEDCICNVCSCPNVEPAKTKSVDNNKATKSESKVIAAKSTMSQAKDVLAKKSSVKIKKPSGTEFQEKEIGHTTIEGIKQVETSTSRTHPDECICEICSCVGPSGEKMVGKQQSMGQQPSKSSAKVSSTHGVKQVETSTSGKLVQQASRSSAKVANASTHGMDCTCDSCKCMERLGNASQRDMVTGPGSKQASQKGLPEVNKGDCDCSTPCSCAPCQDEKIRNQVQQPSEVMNKADCDCSKPCYCGPCQNDKTRNQVQQPSEVIKKMPSEQIQKMPSATIKQELQKTLGETCRCRNEIQEIMKALENIKCSCDQAEFTMSGKMAPPASQQQLQKSQSLLNKSRQQMQPSQQQVLQNQSMQAAPSAQAKQSNQMQTGPTDRKMFVKKASNFGQTMSGLQMALKNVQAKCVMKDRLIAAMTGELEKRGEDIDYDRVFSNAKILPTMEFDMASDVQSVVVQGDHSQLVSNVMYQVDNRDQGTEPVRNVSSKAVEVRTHKSKHRKCAKKCEKKDECNVHQILQREEVNCQQIDLNNFEIVNIRRITEDSLMVKWTVPGYEFVVGYDIYVNGSLVSKVLSGSRTSAMMHSLDLSKSVQITIYAVTKCGRCEPPAIAIYEIQS